MSGAEPRVGLVLGAGGVTGGAFHAGVLAALEQATGWDPREAAIAVGTSAGSITATALRAGLCAADMLARAESRSMSAQGQQLMGGVGPLAASPLRPAVRVHRPAGIAALLARAAARPFSAAPWTLLAGLIPDGSVSTDAISEGIGGLFPDNWPLAPLWICAVGQADGRRVVFGRDPLRPPVAAAVAASCAIPGFFRPVTIDGKAYVDGGVHSPTNADLLTGEGLDLVLVSSPMSLSGRHLQRGVSQAVRLWSRALLDAEVLRLRRRGVPVVAFQPTPDDAAVMGANAMDPGPRAAVARQARESTLRRIARSDSRDRLALLFD